MEDGFSFWQIVGMAAAVTAVIATEVMLRKFRKKADPPRIWPTYSKIAGEWGRPATGAGRVVFFHEGVPAAHRFVYETSYNPLIILDGDPRLRVCLAPRSFAFVETSAGLHRAQFSIGLCWKSEITSFEVKDGETLYIETVYSVLGRNTLRQVELSEIRDWLSLAMHIDERALPFDRLAPKSWLQRIWQRLPSRP